MIPIRVPRFPRFSSYKLGRNAYNEKKAMKTVKIVKKEVLLLHGAVMLFGLSGVIGQLVEVPAVLVTLGRVICSSALLLLLSVLQRDPLRLDSRKDYAIAFAAGVVMAIHWTAFFQSIQVSTVAIGTITFSTFPLFLTFLEPLVFHEKLCPKNIVTAMFLLLGVLITLPTFSLESRVTVGVLWGMLCSLTYAVATLANRYLSGKYKGHIICLYEQGTAAIVLLPALLFVETAWTVRDVLGVACIGFICTACGFSLFVSAQKNVKAQTAGIISGMESLYGILFALLFLREVPSIRTIVGGAVILGAGLYASVGKEM